ncbi:AAA family ATPase [candidate division KSB1 bacterium]|nr:AAA family ATPase [candidate division KSB1 bacterium]
MANIQKNPFVGLRPFESEDSLYFFGRNEQTKALLKLLHETHFLAVVGSSGCGKSSLVRAGLILHLEAGFLVQERDVWHIARMKPGDQPMMNLAQALLTALKQESTPAKVTEFATSLQEQGVHAALDQIVPVLTATDSNLLLLVDQFEEIFRFSMNPQTPDKKEEAVEFVATLLRLAEQADTPIYVCLTMRSDYLGDCDQFQGLPEAMNRSQYLVPRLTRAQRREAILGPIQLAGATISPPLLDRLLNETIEERDDLPVLQHALMLTWNAWAKAGDGAIEISHYEQIGTIHHALSRHADEALNELSKADQLHAQRLFQALTETDASNRQIRRPTHLNDLSAIVEASPEKMLAIIQQFRKDERNFLVLSSQNAADNPLVDISHESLIRQWEKLNEWVQIEAESVKIYRRLTESAELYQQGKADLYRAADLELALEWLKKQNPNIAWAKQYYTRLEFTIKFLKKSQRVRKQELSKIKKIQKDYVQTYQENALLWEKRYVEKKKSFRLLFFLSLLLSITLLFALYFKYKERKRTLLANFNLSKVFEEKALKSFESAYQHQDEKNYQFAWLYSTEALKQEIDLTREAIDASSLKNLFSIEMAQKCLSQRWFSPFLNFHTGEITSIALSPDEKIIASASYNEISLWDISSGHKIRDIDEWGVNSIKFSPDGKLLASASDYEVTIWNVFSGKQIRSFKEHLLETFDVAFSSDGKLIASASADSTIQIWEVSSGKKIGTLLGHTGDVLSLAFNPCKKILVSASSDSTICLWDLLTLKKLSTLIGHTASVTSVAFSQDGQMVVSGSMDTTVRVWNTMTGNQIGLLKNHNAGLNAVMFSPNGKIVASGSMDRSIRLWNIDQQDLIRIIEGHTGSVNSIIFTHDGKKLISGSEDQTIRLWNVEDGNQIHPLKGHSNSITSLAFSSDGQILASSSDDQTIRLWNVSSGNEIYSLHNHYGNVKCITFNYDGSILASGSNDKTIRLWEISSCTEIKTLYGHQDNVNCITFSPDGKLLASGSSDSTVRIWNVTTGHQIYKFSFFNSRVNCVSYSPDGKLLAIGTANNLIHIWDPVKIKKIFTLKKHKAEVINLAYSPDGKLLASASLDQTIILWNTTNGNQIRSFDGHSDFVTSLAFSPDGKILVSGSFDKTIRFWSIESGIEIRTFNGFNEYITCVSFNPYGNIIASGSTNSMIRVWDVAFSQENRTLKGHDDSINKVVFSPNGQLLASASTDKTVRIWEVSSGREIYTLKGHVVNAKSLHFFDDQKLMSVDNWDRTIRLWDLSSGQILFAYRLKYYIEEPVFNHDGKILASACSDHKIRLWSTATGKEIFVDDIKSKDTPKLAISMDGEKIAFNQGTEILVWNVKTHQEIFRLKGHTRRITSLKFNPSGKILASGSYDETLRLWDMTKGTNLRIIKNWRWWEIDELTFSPDGKILLFAYYNFIYLLNTMTGNVIRVLKGHNGSIESVAFSPDGKILASGSTDHTIRLWDISNDNYEDATPDLDPFELFIENGKAKSLLFTFTEGAKFFWDLKQKGLNFVYERKPTLYPQDGYYFEYDPKFRPLLNPPAPGKTKFDQVLEWAMEQERKK